MGKLPVGLQVYNLRDILADNPEKFEEVMLAVKGLGYDGVEMAGLYGMAPEYIRDILIKVGLKPISAHVPLAEMEADAKKVAADYKTIGCEYVAVPYLQDEYRHYAPGPGYETALAAIKNAGEAMKEVGLKLLYHNHDFEFVPLPDGRFGFDDIFERIPSDLLMVEPDTCWIKVAGQDPVSYIKKYGPRCEVVHLKDFIMEGTPKRMYELIGIKGEEAEKKAGFFEFRPVGFGQQIWEPILDAAICAGSKWVIVEQDLHYGLGGLEAARRSREYLKILGW